MYIQYTSIIMVCLFFSLFRIHGVSTGMDRNVCYELMDEHLRELGLNEVSSRDIIDILDGYRGAGYGISSQQELSMSD